MRFAGKVAIVTGGGTGIGRAVALALAREGARVVIANRSASTGEDAAREIRSAGGTAVFVSCDVGDARQVEACVAEALRAHGRLDILVNAAGIGSPRTAATEVDEAEWARILNVNLGGAYRTARAAIPAMARGGGGAVVNVASIAGLEAIPRAAPYVASKGGLVALTRSLALDYAPHRVRVNCVCPAAVDTPMLQRVVEAHPDPSKARLYFQSIHPLGRIGMPEDIAAAVLFLASEDASWITGAILPVDGGYLAGRAAGQPVPLP